MARSPRRPRARPSTVRVKRQSAHRRGQPGIIMPGDVVAYRPSSGRAGSGVEIGGARRIISTSRRTAARDAPGMWTHECAAPSKRRCQRARLRTRRDIPAPITLARTPCRRRRPRSARDRPADAASSAILRPALQVPPCSRCGMREGGAEPELARAPAPPTGPSASRSARAIRRSARRTPRSALADRSARAARITPRSTSRPPLRYSGSAVSSSSSTTARPAVSSGSSSE